MAAFASTGGANENTDRDVRTTLPRRLRFRSTRTGHEFIVPLVLALVMLSLSSLAGEKGRVHKYSASSKTTEGEVLTGEKKHNDEDGTIVTELGRLDWLAATIAGTFKELFQDHHIIPWKFHEHELLRFAGLDDEKLSMRWNMVILPKEPGLLWDDPRGEEFRRAEARRFVEQQARRSSDPDGDTGESLVKHSDPAARKGGIGRSAHLGNHTKIYSNAIGEELERIWDDVKRIRQEKGDEAGKAEAQKRVFELTRSLRAGLKRGKIVLYSQETSPGAVPLSQWLAGRMKVDAGLDRTLRSLSDGDPSAAVASLQGTVAVAVAEAPPLDNPPFDQQHAATARPIGGVDLRVRVGDIPIDASGYWRAIDRRQFGVKSVAGKTYTLVHDVPAQTMDSVLDLRRRMGPLNGLMFSLDPTPEDYRTAQTLAQYHMKLAQVTGLMHPPKPLLLEGAGLRSQAVFLGADFRDTVPARIAFDADVALKRIILGTDPVTGQLSETFVRHDQIMASMKSFARFWFVPTGVRATIRDDCVQVSVSMVIKARPIEFGVNGLMKDLDTSPDLEGLAALLTAKLPELERRVPAIAELHRLYEALAIVGLMDESGSIDLLYPDPVKITAPRTPDSVDLPGTVFTADALRPVVIIGGVDLSMPLLDSAPDQQNGENAAGAISLSAAVGARPEAAAAQLIAGGRFAEARKLLDTLVPPGGAGSWRVHLLRGNARVLEQLAIKPGSQPVRPQTPSENIGVESVSVPETAAVGDIVAVKARVRAIGYKAAHPVQLVLTDRLTHQPLHDEKGDAVLQTVSIDGPEPRDVELRFKVDHTGIIDVTVTAPPQPGEINDKDNVATASMEALDPKINVLYVEGYPRWEFRNIKTAMIGESTVNISCILQSADPGVAQEGTSKDRLKGFKYFPYKHFPETLEQLKECDVIVFGDVDPRYFTDAQLALIRTFVEEGGGFGMIAGEHHAPMDFRNTPISDLLPVSIKKTGSEPGRSFAQGFQPVVTKEGDESPIFRFSGLDKTARDQFLREKIQPVFWYCDWVSPKPTARVLAEHPFEMIDGRKAPILIAGESGSGRTLFSTIDETWRWRIYTGEEFFNAYWLKQLRYLGSGRKRGSRAITFTALREVHQTGDQVRLTLDVLHRQLPTRLQPQMIVDIVDSQRQVVGRETLVQEQGQTNRYTAKFSTKKAGSFTAKLALPDSPEQTVRFEVRDSAMPPTPARSLEPYDLTSDLSELNGKWRDRGLPAEMITDQLVLTLRDAERDYWLAARENPRAAMMELCALNQLYELAEKRIESAFFNEQGMLVNRGRDGDLPGPMLVLNESRAGDQAAMEAAVVKMNPARLFLEMNAALAEYKEARDNANTIGMDAARRRFRLARGTFETMSATREQGDGSIAVLHFAAGAEAVLAKPVDGLASFYALDSGPLRVVRMCLDAGMYEPAAIVMDDMRSSGRQGFDSLGFEALSAYCSLGAARSALTEPATVRFKRLPQRPRLFMLPLSMADPTKPVAEARKWSPDSVYYLLNQAVQSDGRFDLMPMTIAEMAATPPAGNAQDQMQADPAARSLKPWQNVSHTIQGELAVSADGLQFNLAIENNDAKISKRSFRVDFANPQEGIFAAYRFIADNATPKEMKTAVPAGETRDCRVRSSLAAAIPTGAGPLQAWCAARVADSRVLQEMVQSKDSATRQESLLVNAERLVDDGDFDAAERYLKRIDAPDMSAAWRSHYLLALCALAHGDSKAAQQAADFVLASDNAESHVPGSSTLQLLRLVHQGGAGWLDYLQTREHSVRFDMLNTLDTDYALDRAALRYAQGDSRGAVRDIDWLAHHGPIPDDLGRLAFAQHLLQLCLLRDLDAPESTLREKKQ